MKPSRQVLSRQDDAHPRLEEIVRKHGFSAFRKPVADHSRPAFAQIRETALSWTGAIRWDTGCGTGESTLALARRFPEDLIIGLDKSQHRLEKGLSLLAASPIRNCHFFRIDLVDFWLLLSQSPLTVTAQYFFFPNPWPKPEHLLRRWPAHPIFPYALAPGGRFEVRSNWEVYVTEFRSACRLLTGVELAQESYSPDPPITPFERKYAQSGQTLHRAWGELPPLRPLAPGES